MNRTGLLLAFLIPCSAAAQPIALRQLSAATPAGLPAVYSSPAAPVSAQAKAAGEAVEMSKDLIYVVDGDTIYYGPKDSDKLQIRIIGIDTPETAHYGAGKFEGQPEGPAATKCGRKLISDAKKISYLPLGTDKYGRTLAHIFTDDSLYAVHMLAKGLAYETITKYGDNGRPDLAEAILAAAAAGPKPEFQNPHDWRAENWSEEKEREELERDLALPRVKLNKSEIIYDDGDTITYRGVTFRLVGFDTPEIKHLEVGIPYDQEYGPEAAAFTEKTLREASKLEYISVGNDVYGRTLALIFVDDELLGVKVIKAGLAYETVSKYGATGHPGFAREMLRAFQAMPTPPFQNPFYWRLEHQIKP